MSRARVQAPATVGAPRSGAATPSSVAASLGLKPNEQSMFDTLFRNCDLSNAQQLNGAAVKDLFEQTALERKTLSDIWRLSDRGGKKALSLDDFYIALRLISIAQNGLPVSTVSLKQYTELPLPVFGPQAKALAAKMASGHAAQHAAAVAAVASGAMAGPGTAPHQAAPTQQQPTQVLSGVPGPQPNMPQPVPLAMAASASGGTIGVPPPGAPPVPGAIDPFTMTAEERATYLVHFASADRDRDTFVSGQEAFEFFMQSGLDAVTLRGIWLLADAGGDGKLDQEEFSVAMHLVWKVRGGLPLPATLPPSLAPGAPRPPAAVLAQAIASRGAVPPQAQPQGQAPASVTAPTGVPPLGRPQSINPSAAAITPPVGISASPAGQPSIARRASFGSPGVATTVVAPPTPVPPPSSTTAATNGAPADFLNFPSFDAATNDPVISIDAPAPAKTAVRASPSGPKSGQGSSLPPSLLLSSAPTSNGTPAAAPKDDFAAFDAFGSSPAPTGSGSNTPNPSKASNPLDAGLDMSMFGATTPVTPTPSTAKSSPTVTAPHGATGSSMFGGADPFASSAHPPAHPPSATHSYAPAPLSNSTGLASVHQRRMSGSASASAALLGPLTAQVDIAAREKDDSARRYMAANQALEASSAQLATLKDRLEDYKKQTALNNQKIEFTLQRQRDIEEQTREFQSLVDEQDRALADEKERARVIDEQLATTRRQLEVMSETLTQRKAEITAAKASTEVLKREHQDAERSLALLENEVEHLRASIQSSEVIKSGKATLLGSRKETEAELKRQKEELTTALANIQAELKSQQAEIEVLKAAQPAKQAEKSALEKQIKEAQQQLWEAKQQATSLRAANEAAAAVAAAAASVPLVHPKTAPATAPVATVAPVVAAVETKTAATTATSTSAAPWDETPGSGNDPFGSDLFATSPTPPPAKVVTPVVVTPAVVVAAPAKVVAVTAPTPVVAVVTPAATPAAVVPSASPSASSASALDEFEWEELDPSVLKGTSANGAAHATPAATTTTTVTVTAAPVAAPVPSQSPPPPSSPPPPLPSVSTPTAAAPSPNQATDFDAPPTAFVAAPTSHSSKLSLAHTPSLSPLPNAAATTNGTPSASPAAAGPSASFSPTGASSNWDPWSDEPAEGKADAPTTPAKASTTTTASSSSADPWDTNDFGFAGASPIPAPTATPTPVPVAAKVAAPAASPVAAAPPTASPTTPAPFDFDSDPWGATPTFTPLPAATHGEGQAPPATAAAPAKTAGAPVGPKPGNLASPSAPAGTDTNKWAAGFAAEASWADDF